MSKYVDVRKIVLTVITTSFLRSSRFICARFPTQLSANQLYLVIYRFLYFLLPRNNNCKRSTFRIIYAMQGCCSVWWHESNAKKHSRTQQVSQLSSIKYDTAMKQCRICKRLLVIAVRNYGAVYKGRQNWHPPWKSLKNDYRRGV